MIGELGTAKLRTGETLVMKLVTAPAAEYAEKLVHFLEHKAGDSRRSIVQRLRGDYAAFCCDKYFIGEIDGRIAGQIWYGYATTGTGIANFGHVYTEPDHRKKGITEELMKVFLDDFSKSPVRAALCGTGTPWVASIYFKYGFQAVRENATSGMLILLNKDCGGNFNEFEAEYFRPGQEIVTLPGTMEHRHDVDEMLKGALDIRGMQAKRLSVSTAINSYQSAYFMAEDGQGVLSVAKATGGSVVGWSFCLNPASRWEGDAKVFDFEIHPNYVNMTERFVRESLGLFKDKGVTRAYAYQPAVEKSKIAVLGKAGFQEAARLSGYCAFDNAASDLVILSAAL